MERTVRLILLLAVIHEYASMCTVPACQVEMCVLLVQMLVSDRHDRAQ